MVRKNMFTMAALLAATACLSVIVQSGTAQTDSPTKSDGFKPVMPLLSLMAEQDRHFDNILDLVRDAEAADRFEKMRHEAYALAEMGNINGYHSGAVRHQDYRQWAGDLKDLALTLAGNAERKQADAFAGLAKKLNSTCKACHNKYK